MVGEGKTPVEDELKLDPHIEKEVSKFLKDLEHKYPDDRIDGPKPTRLFAMAVVKEDKSGFRQYVAVTTYKFQKSNRKVYLGEFHVVVRTKDGAPGPNWIKVPPHKKDEDGPWWDYYPPSQKITKDIMDCVAKARESMHKVK